MTLRKTITVACLTVLGTVALTVPAQASPGDAIAGGDAGSAMIGDTVIEPVTPCSTEGTLANSGSNTSKATVVSFGNSKSACTVDDAGEIATVTITGGEFRLDALRQYNGPRIRLSSYTAKCETTKTEDETGTHVGSKASFQFSGLSGIKAPSNIPPNHVVTVPGGNGSDTKPLATVTFNETIVPDPPDGGMTVNLMHIRMFPQGGPASGDVYIGSVRCSPVS
jgi:hypothetical protein